MRFVKVPNGHTFLGFFVASLVLALTPGPDNLYVFNQSLVRGARAGIAITLGLCAGLLLQSTVVALGLGQLLQRFVWAEVFIACVGSGYLLYLAIGAWQATPTLNLAESKPIPAHKGDYWRGVLMNLSNPKVLLFFLAFLPQFVVAGGLSPGLQIMVLGFVFMAAALLVFVSVALLAERLAGWLSEPVLRSVNRVAALVLAVLAARLLWFAVTTVSAVSN